LDNYCVRFSNGTEQPITENHILHVPHPLYSPDLAPSDFWSFGFVKTSLVGKKLDAPENLPEAVTEFLGEIQPLELEIVFSHWIVEKKVPYSAQARTHEAGLPGRIMPASGAC
jgi:hypothetical protein